MCSHTSPYLLPERRYCVWHTVRHTQRRSCCWLSPFSTVRVRVGLPWPWIMVGWALPSVHSHAVALAVKVFFEDTLKFFLSLYGHRLPVLSMSISHDDNLIVTASADKNVKIWGASGRLTHQRAHAPASHGCAQGWTLGTATAVCSPMLTTLWQVIKDPHLHTRARTYIFSHTAILLVHKHAQTQQRVHSYRRRHSSSVFAADALLLLCRQGW